MRKNTPVDSLLTTDQYTLLRHQLQYFFLINPDSIVQNIAKDSSFSESKGTSNAFSIAFKHVFEGATPYCDFLHPTSLKCFFGIRDSYHSATSGIRHLLYLTLLNNCVFHSYLTLIAKASSPISISAKNEAQIFHGIQEIIFPSEHPFKKERGSTRSQFWQNRKRIYKTELDNQNKTAKNIPYTFRILKDLESSNQSGKVFLAVPQYQAPLAAFLFSEDPCAKFSRSLLSDSSMQITPYEGIWCKYRERNAAFNAPVDRLIFSAEIESVFGFTYFRAISHYIEAIYNSDPNERKSLKQLEGQIFYDIIDQAANLPLYFNKSIFLKYACSVFANLPSITNQYFEDNASIYVRRLPDKILPDDQQRIVFFDLAQKFFLILERITIPVLYALWDVVLYELNQKAPESFFDRNALESYLSQNFTAIFSDYFSIPDKEILSWGNGVVLNKRIDNKYLSDYFLNSNSNTEDPVLPKYLSQYPKQTMQYLIRSYCNTNTFNKKRAPFIFPQNSAQKENSLLSPLINSILEPEEQDNNKKIANEKSRKLDQLELDHKYSLFKYLFES